MDFSKGWSCIRLHCSIIPSSFTQCRNWNDWQIWHELSVLAGRVSVNKQEFYSSSGRTRGHFQLGTNLACFYFCFGVPRHKEISFSKDIFITKSAHFFFYHAFAIRFMFSLGRSTEPPEPPLDPPLDPPQYLSTNTKSGSNHLRYAHNE